MTRPIWYPREINLPQVNRKNKREREIPWLIFKKDEYWYVESRNVLVRITGKSNNNSESFLINAHYGT